MWTTNQSVKLVRSKYNIFDRFHINLQDFSKDSMTISPKTEESEISSFGSITYPHYDKSNYVTQTTSFRTILDFIKAQRLMGHKSNMTKRRIYPAKHKQTF